MNWQRNVIQKFSSAGSIPPPLPLIVFHFFVYVNGSSNPVTYLHRCCLHSLQNCVHRLWCNTIHYEQHMNIGNNFVLWPICTDEKTVYAVVFLFSVFTVILNTLPYQIERRDPAKTYFVMYEGITYVFLCGLSQCSRLGEVVRKITCD